MASLVRLVINSNGTADDFKSQCNLAPLGLPAVNNFVDYVAGLTGGNMIGAQLAYKVGTVQATATFTVSAGGSSAGQAGSLLNVSLTGRASNPAANEFVVSATAATQAANMAAAINASSSFTGKVTAVAVGAVVTVTAVVPGLIGNGLQISAGNLGNVVAGAFANGTDGTAYTIDLR